MSELFIIGILGIVIPLVLGLALLYFLMLFIKWAWYRK